MLQRTVQDVASSRSGVAEGVLQCAAPALTQRSSEERAAREIFKRYPSRLTIGKLTSHAATYRLPCGTRLMVPSPGDHATFPLTGFIAISP